MALYLPNKEKTESIVGFRVKVAVIDVGMDDALNGKFSFWEKSDSIHGKQVVRTILDISPYVEMYKYNYNPKTLKEFEEILEMVIETRPHIINVSSSGTVSSERELSLFKKASDLGIVIVVAAGNEGREINNDFKPFPLSYKTPNIVSVGALDKKGEIASYSNRGDEVDVYLNGEIFTKIDGVEYFFKGTSASTAIATAHISNYISPQISPMEAKDIFLKNSKSKKTNRGIASRE